MVDNNDNFTNKGLHFAKLSDALLPEDSPARFFKKDGTPNTSWTVNNNDVYGRAPKTFKTRKEYMDYIRNDDIAGARHNIFIYKGKRYIVKNITIYETNPKDQDEADYIEMACLAIENEGDLIV